MKIFGVKTYSQSSFKAHYYDSTLENEILLLRRVITDNNPNLGNEPEVIITEGLGCEDYTLVDLDKAKPIPMHKMNNNHFIARIHEFINKYKIYYKDTGLVDDNNGRNYDLSESKIEKLTKKAIKASKISHNHPLTSIISAGEVSGKLVLCDDMSNLPKDFDTETPTILLSKYDLDVNPYTIPKNIRGIILERGSAGILFHQAANLRNLFDTVVVTYDEKEIEKLEALNNQFINLSTLNKKMTFNKIDKLASIEIKTPVSVKIPEMQYIDTLVDSKDYELNTVGPKAYKLRIMEELADKGVLDGVQIPRSFAVTHGFIDKLLKEGEGHPSGYPPRKSPSVQEIKNKIEDTGITGHSLMYRSSFNGEDVDNYSAAGLYKSLDYGKSMLNYCIIDVARSKNSPNAVHSRKMYGIPDEIIKPTVIIQEAIRPDYAFTIYTKDPTENEDILTINMNTKYTSERKDPYVLQYNKKDKTLKIQSLERNIDFFRFDEECNIMINHPSKDKLVKTWNKIKPIFEKVVKNAIALENYFGSAQDIEGGIKGSEIYFWQTRNIVKKLKR